MLIECVCGCLFAAAQPACPQCDRTAEQIEQEKSGDPVAEPDPHPELDDDFELDEDDEPTDK
jgi:hypothetical protein